MGARKIGVTTVPPIGCLPASITIFGKDNNNCVKKMNKVALSFNNKLNDTSIKLQKKLFGLKLVILDIYQPLLDLVNHPTNNGNTSKYIVFFIYIKKKKSFLGSLGVTSKVATM